MPRYWIAKKLLVNQLAVIRVIQPYLLCPKM